MSDRPVFIYAATYADAAGAEADYETLLELHAAKLVGTYDVALVTKDADGKVHVEKHEKPTQHGAWGGIAVGAAVGVLAAPAVIPAALVGGIIGGLGGHFKKGIARDDAKETGRSHRSGTGNAARDRGVAPGRTARQGAHARRKDDREGNRRRQQRVQAGTRRGREGVRRELSRSPLRRARQDSNLRPLATAALDRVSAWALPSRAARHRRTPRRSVRATRGRPQRRGS